MAEPGVIDNSGSPPPARLSTEDEGRTYGDPPDEPGRLLEEPLWQEAGEGQRTPMPDVHRRVATAAWDIWHSVEEWHRPFREQWKVNAAKRRGLATARLRQSSDHDLLEFFVPRGSTPDATPEVNKLAQLCRRFTSVMFADPPAPDLEPWSTDDADEDATQQAQRILEDLQSQRNLHTVARAEEAFDLAHTFGSGFTHTLVDPRGSGRRPVQVDAHPLAGTVADATIDPMTGLDVESADLLRPRYVRQDGTLTDRIGEAATRWEPGLRKQVLTGRHCRPIPHTATNMEECIGFQLAELVPLRELRRAWPDLLGSLSLDEQMRLTSWSADDESIEDLLNVGQQLETSQNMENVQDRLCLVLRTYMLADTPGYDDGLHLITIGRQWCAWRKPWIHTTDEGERRVLPIPVSQYAQFKEGRQTFYKVALSELLGGANTARAAQVAQLLEHLDRLNHQKVFLPYTSMLTPEQLSDPTGTVHYFNPGGEPVFPPYPTFPRDAYNVYEMSGRDMETGSGLNEAADNLESGNVKSGRHALAVVAQAQAGLSEPNKHTVNGYLRDCYIELELARTLSVPQRLRWRTESGRHRQERWMGADLTTSVDVQLKAGTMSMQTPATKLQYNTELFGLGLLSREDMIQSIRQHMSGIVQLQDDEFRNRVRGQIAEWEEGRPAGSGPELDPVTSQPALQPVTDPLTGQPSIDPATGAPLMQPVPDPVAARIWAPVLPDMLPELAQMRLDAIARVMARPRWSSYDPSWRLPVEIEYGRMMQAVQMAAAAAQAAHAAPAGRGRGQGRSGGEPRQTEAQAAQQGTFPS